MFGLNTVSDDSLYSKFNFEQIKKELFSVKITKDERRHLFVKYSLFAIENNHRNLFLELHKLNQYYEFVGAEDSIYYLTQDKSVLDVLISWRCNKELHELLIEQGYKIQKRDGHLLVGALVYCTNEIVRNLMEQGVECCYAKHYGEKKITTLEICMNHNRSDFFIPIVERIGVDKATKIITSYQKKSPHRGSGPFLDMLNDYKLKLKLESSLGEDDGARGRTKI